MRIKAVLKEGETGNNNKSMPIASVHFDNITIASPYHIMPNKSVIMAAKKADQKNKFVQLLFIKMLITYALKADKGIFYLFRGITSIKIKLIEQL